MTKNKPNDGDEAIFFFPHKTWWINKGSWLLPFTSSSSSFFSFFCQSINHSFNSISKSQIPKYTNTKLYCRTLLQDKLVTFSFISRCPQNYYPEKPKKPRDRNRHNTVPIQNAKTSSLFRYCIHVVLRVRERKQFYRRTYLLYNNSKRHTLHIRAASCCFPVT